MKKLTAVLLTFSLLFCLASCFGTQKDGETQIYSSFESVTSGNVESNPDSNKSKSENSAPSTGEITSKVSDLKSTATAVLKTTVKAATITGEKTTSAKPTLPHSVNVPTSESVALKTKTESKTTKPKTTRVRHTTSLSDDDTTMLSVTSSLHTETVGSTATTKAEATIEFSEKETENSYVAPVTSAKSYCTISIDCSTVFKNLKKLSESKKAYIPTDGKMLKTVRIEITSGDTVFDILKKACAEGLCSDNCVQCQNSGIQIEYTNTFTGSVYVRSIHNLSEKDCGSKSGWLYKVNGTFADTSCDGYKVKNGDRIEWVYTCDLGSDV